MQVQHAGTHKLCEGFTLSNVTQASWRYMKEQRLRYSVHKLCEGFTLSNVSNRIASSKPVKSGGYIDKIKLLHVTTRAFTQITNV